jgi:opacity protein-like surface antigen
MIGNAFAGMKSGFGSGFNSSDTLFGAGGALGVAFDRPNGQLRLEVEGMGRDTYDGAVIETPMLQHVVTNNWSAMVNAWRDLMLTDRVGIYGGGGIGAGGYQLGFRSDVGTTFIEPESGFAWQAGGGVIWEATDRMTFDVGYRFFLIDRLPFEPAISGFGHQFHASELMFTLRIYEPFRGWRS